MQGGYDLSRLSGFNNINKVEYIDEKSVSLQSGAKVVTGVSEKDIIDAVNKFGLAETGMGSAKKFYENKNITNLVISNVEEITCRVPEKFINDNSEFLESGIQVLLKFFPGAQPYYVSRKIIPDRTVEIVKGYNFKTVRISGRYPSYHPVIIAEKICEHRFSITEDYLKGTLILKIDEVIYLGQCFSQNCEWQYRLIGLFGDGFKENKYIEVKLGTPVKEIIDNNKDDGIESVYIKNNILCGTEINMEKDVINKDTFALCAVPRNNYRSFMPFVMPGIFNDSYHNVFVAKYLPVYYDIDTRLHGEKRECISCLACQRVCPRVILPNLVNNLIKVEEWEEVYNMNLMECIECGLCSYVCPSKIELVDNFKKAKLTIKKELEL